MIYQIYTFPACEKCHKAIQLFKEKKISYEEISAGTPEGRTKIRDFSRKHDDKLEKEIKDGIRWLKLPLIVSQNNGEIRIYQDKEGIEKVLSENENSRVS